MAKAQDILTLARFAVQCNREKTLQACGIIAANEPENSALKSELGRILAREKSLAPQALPVGTSHLLMTMEPGLNLEDLHLPSPVREQAKRFMAERSHGDLLRQHGLCPPAKILLSGPPGNGKTSLAGALAQAMGMPLLVIDFAAIVASHLGQTGANLAKALRGVPFPAVVFLDEMETLLSERANTGNDVGEQRRIVSTLLLEIDRLPDHLVFVGATNHAEMLDRAVVRRFDYLWELPQPDLRATMAWMQRFAAKHPSAPIDQMPAFQPGSSYSDLQREAEKWLRGWIMDNHAHAPQL